MLPTLIIGLREGLEASLIVGIVAAFLRKEGRSDALRQVWIGVVLALVLCVGVGVALEVANRDLSQQKQEGLETVIGLIAVAMVTYMVVWMKRNSRDLKKELEGAAASALATNSARALVLMAFLAVLREGFETAVFLIAQFNETNNPGLAGTGAAIGVVIAVILGYALYRGGVRINLSKFFRATGLVLVLVAAGLLATAAMTAHEAGWIDFGQRQAMNITAVVRPGTVLESILTGVLGWQARPSVLSTVLYFLYLVPFAAYVVWPQKVRAAAANVAAKANANPVASPLSRPQLALRAGVALVVLAGAGSLVATVGSTKHADASAGGNTVTVTLSGSGCAIAPASIGAGPVDFVVHNTGTSTYTEAELVSGGRILAERENVLSGDDTTFSYDVSQGTQYAVSCGTGSKDQPLTVTAGSASAAGGSSTTAVQLAEADSGYVSYVQQQVAQLQTATTVFTDAVRAGNLAAAEASYPAARVGYERIEPVAESFGDLDPLIDNRIDDAGSLAKLTGFHRIEYAMYVSRSLAGMAPVATQLDQNIAKLKTLVATVTFQPAELANGSTGLLDEVGKTKVTGEEERYSHIDMVDLAANVAGSEAAYDLLAPALRTLDASLATQVATQFANVDKVVAQFSTGSGPTDYVSYSKVTDAQRRQISQAVDALAAPLSQVAGVVVKVAPASGVAVQLAAADAGYVTYVQQQVAQLQASTTVFTDAVRAGNLAAAEAAYPAARVGYERIEPVAESFGDLDPEIDNRIDDAGSLAKLTGFHRIEYAMYVSKSLAGMAPVATQLDTNIAQLKTLVATVTFQPAELANGATGLLDEVGKTKVTGEEERYSHIDLVDLAANVAGSEAAYDLLAPAVRSLDPTLAAQVAAQFANVDKVVAQFSTGSGPTDYVSYSTVTDAQRKAISQAVDALAAPLSQVAGVVVTA